MSVDSPARPGPAASAAVIRARRLPLRFGAGVLALAAADVVIDPTHTHVPLCPLRSLTGLWCPFCGSLRAVAELTRGHVGVALHDNALLVLGLPIALAWWWAWLLRAGGGDPPRPWSRRAATGVVLLLFAFAVVRNVPIAAALRPPG